MYECESRLRYNIGLLNSYSFVELSSYTDIFCDPDITCFHGARGWDHNSWPEDSKKYLGSKKIRIAAKSCGVMFGCPSGLCSGEILSTYRYFYSWETIIWQFFVYDCQSSTPLWGRQYYYRELIPQKKTTFQRNFLRKRRTPGELENPVENLLYFFGQFCALSLTNDHNPCYSPDWLKSGRCRRLKGQISFIKININNI